MIGQITFFDKITLSKYDIVGRTNEVYKHAISNELVYWILKEDEPRRYPLYKKQSLGLLGAIKALTESDNTHGAYFWEGNQYLQNTANDWYKRLNAVPPIVVKTIVLGETTFMKYNPAHSIYGIRSNPWP